MGKGGGLGQTYNYFGTMAGGLCVGPVDELVAVIVNGEQAWPQGKPWEVGQSININQLRVFDAQTWVCQQTHTSTDDNAPGSDPAFWKEYSFPRGTNAYDDFTMLDNTGQPLGVFRLYWGTDTQTVDFYLQAANNDGGVKGNFGSGDTHPDYRGLCYCVIIDFNFGQEVQNGPNIEVILRRKPKQTIVTGAPATIVDGQANLAAVLAEVLTEKNCLGLPASLIDATSFQAVGDWLDTNGTLYGASVLVDTQETLRSFMDKVMAMFDGYIRYNAATQKIEIGVYHHGEVPSVYTTITADMLTKRPKITTESWQATISRATVRFNSRQLAYQQTSLQVDDPRAFYVLGVVKEQALDRPYCARAKQAMAIGRETLRLLGHAHMEAELEVRREFGRSITSGDYVLVDVELEPGGSQVYQFFRVTQRRIPPTGPIVLKLFGDNTLAAVPWNSADPVIPPQNAVVPAITTFRFLEVPTSLSGLRGAIVALAARPNDLIVGCQLYFDTNPSGNFTSLGTFSNFAAVATMGMPALPAITSIVADSSGAKAVITFASTHNLQPGDNLTISGASNAAFNVTDATLVAATTTTVTYTLASIVTANLAASGTLVAAFAGMSAKSIMDYSLPSVTSIVSDATGTNGVITFSKVHWLQIGDKLKVSGCNLVSAVDVFNTSSAVLTAVTSTTATYSLNATTTAALSATGTPRVLYAGPPTSILHASVDTTQVDDDYFSQQYTALDGANDVMLAFILQKVASGTDAGQVDESGGYQIMEICSVTTSTLVSAGKYSLRVLRGRRGTNPTAFGLSNTEIWLIPRAMLDFFTDASFDVIRANRLKNVSPQYAQFRLAPFTFISQLAVADATTQQFRFPLKSASAPEFTLSAPAAYASNFTAASWPYRINVRGVWSDPDSNMVEIKSTLRSSADTADRNLGTINFSPRSTYNYLTTVSIENPGSYTLKMVARDSTGLVQTRELYFNVAGSAGSPRCAFPSAYDKDWVQMLNASGTTPEFGDITEANFHYIVPTFYVPPGVIKLLCSTPGSTIKFQTSNVMTLRNGILVFDTKVQTYVEGSNEPFHALAATRVLDDSDYVGSLKVWTTAPGYQDSPTVIVLIPRIYDITLPTQPHV